MVEACLLRYKLDSGRNCTVLVDTDFRRVNKPSSRHSIRAYYDVMQKQCMHLLVPVSKFTFVVVIAKQHRGVYTI